MSNPNCPFTEDYSLVRSETIDFDSIFDNIELLELIKNLIPELNQSNGNHYWHTLQYETYENETKAYLVLKSNEPVFGNHQYIVFYAENYIDDLWKTTTRNNMGADLTGEAKWFGGVLGPDGKIYGIPLNATDILIIDPANGTATNSNMGADLTGEAKWSGGVLGPDGKIYGIPLNATDILIIDPVNGTATLSNMGADLTGEAKWSGGVLGPDGKIYGIPLNATDILIIDPVNGTATLSNMGADLTGEAKWFGGVLGPDGKIYGISYNAQNILIIDPEADSATLSNMGADLTSNFKWSGGVLGPDGKIYGIPYNAQNILIIDPANDTATRSNMGANLTGDLNFTSDAKWQGGVLGPDGKIYGIPWNVEDILIIDPEADSATLSNMGADLTSNFKWSGGVLGPDGKIYGIPFSAQDILIIVTLILKNQISVGYDPENEININGVNGSYELITSEKFSGLKNITGSSKFLSEEELLEDKFLDLNDYVTNDTKLKIWVAEHREVNDCGNPCTDGQPASLTLLIEQLFAESPQENKFLFGAHVGRILASVNLSDSCQEIYGDAVLVGKPTKPGLLGPEEPVSDPSYQSWLGQAINIDGSVVKTGTNEWSPAYCIGWDNYFPSGAFKQVNNTERLVPYSTIGLEEDIIVNEDWLQISSGGSHSLGIKKDGTLWSWGNNSFGRTGLGIDAGNTLKPIQIKFVLNSSDEEPVEFLGPWQQVSAGDAHSLAISAEGDLYSFGRNANGRTGLGDDEGNTLRPTKINLPVPSSSPEWQQVSAGAAHSLAITAEGDLYSFGLNNNGRTGLDSNSGNTLTPTRINQVIENINELVPSSSPEWQQVSAGAAHSLAITAEGDLYSFGLNVFGQTGLGENFQNITRPAKLTEVFENFPNSTLSSSPEWQQVSAGALHSLAISTEGNLYSFGFGILSGLGIDDNIENIFKPAKLTKVFENFPNLTLSSSPEWQQVSAGGPHSLAISAVGDLYSFGSNVNGLTGLGINDNTASIQRPFTFRPAKLTEVFENFTNSTLSSSPKWQQVSAGYNAALIENNIGHSLAISTENNLYSFGLNNNGRTGLGTDEGNTLRPTKNLFVYKIYNNFKRGEIGRTKYLRQLGTESLEHGVKFATATPNSLQAWLPLANQSNQIILWRRGDNNNDNSENT
jgi:alpha-tubulin suppressor-like RCC1 family protein